MHSESRGIKKITVLNYSSSSLIGDIVFDSLIALLNEGSTVADSINIRARSFRHSFQFNIHDCLRISLLLLRNICPLMQMFMIILRGACGSREALISRILEFRYKDLSVGDCIVSSYFRDPRTPVLPKLSVNFGIYLLFAVIKISNQIQWLREITAKYKNVESLFFCFETTGFDEIARRYMVANGYNEIRYSEVFQGFRLFKGFCGIALRKSISARKCLYETLPSESISIGKTKIRDLVDRRTRYPYLRDKDVDIDAICNIKAFPSKTTIILFLATISDAQYLYGKSGFGDLHGFQNAIIKWGLENGLNVVVKPHPGMYKEKEYTLNDRRYFETLKKNWCVRSYSENIERSTKDSRLYFVDSKISVKELSRRFRDFLCVTQHGSVAVECAFLGHLGLVAMNSRFICKDKFVIRVGCKDDLEEVLLKWREFNGFNSSQLESLYKYVYLNNVWGQKLFASRLFTRVVPKEVDSAFVEKWLIDYLDLDFDSGRRKLLGEAIGFLSFQNHDFDNVIYNER